MSEKRIETQENQAGGVDLLIERDAGNLIRILTGNRQRSIAIWKRLAKIANEVVADLEEEEQAEADHLRRAGRAI